MDAPSVSRLKSMSKGPVLSILVDASKVHTEQDCILGCGYGYFVFDDSGDQIGH